MFFSNYPYIPQERHGQDQPNYCKREITPLRSAVARKQRCWKSLTRDSSLWYGDAE